MKLLRSNPYRVSFLLSNKNDTTVIDDDNVQVGYRRPQIVTDTVEDDISDTIKWRLFLARQLALLKHGEKWRS
jgi:hypothetical protein